MIARTYPVSLRLAAEADLPEIVDLDREAFSPY